MDRIGGKNITAKVLAIILATVLWLYVMNEQNPPIESTVTANLEVRNLSTKYVVADNPDTVRIKFRGPRSIVAAIMPRDIKAYIDLRGLTEGQHSVKVNAQLPPAVELLEVYPERIAIRMDLATTRQVPVEIKLSGKTPSGILIGKATASPAQVTVEGPKNLVESVAKILAPVDLTEKKSDFTEKVPLIIVNQEGKEIDGLTLYPDKVSVTANLVRSETKKNVDIKTIIYGDLPAGIYVKRVTTEPEKVELNGESSIIEKIDYVYTEPINITGLNQDAVREIKLQLREGVVASSSSVIVRISVGRSDTPSKP